MNKINPSGILQKAGLKVTAGRVRVLQILAERKYPSDVSGIMATLRKGRVGIDPVTVYRILRKFLSHEIIEKTEFQEGKYRYELVSGGRHHHHAVCVKCGTIKDINHCVINAVEENIVRDLHFQVQNHRLEFFGLCENCTRGQVQL